MACQACKSPNIQICVAKAVVISHKCPGGWYNYSMANELAVTEQDQIQQLNSEVVFQRALAVVEHQVENGSTVTEACEAMDVPRAMFYKWVKQGVLADYLAEARKSRSEVAHTMAAGKLPDVMGYMIQIATGKVKLRGASPIAAAKFVWDVVGAGVAQPDSEVEEAAPISLTFVPQMVVFNVTGGAPRMADDGSMEIIEGEFTENEKAAPPEEEAA